MKKFMAICFALVLGLGVGTGTANAVSWTWDLTKLGGNYVGVYSGSGLGGSSTVTYGNSIGFASLDDGAGGYYLTTVNQSLGGNGQLDNGDTFTELGFLSQVQKDGSGFTLFDASTSISYNVLLSFQNLSGYITNYDDNGTSGLANLSDDTFDLVFNAGVGDINMFVDLDNNNSLTGGDLVLATYELLSGEGTSPELINGQGEGQFGVTLGFTSVLNDFWSFSDGTDFADWLSTYGPGSIMMNSLNLGATLGADPIITANNIEFGIYNQGSFTISAVPEPSTMILLGLGLVGFAAAGRKKLF
jgi:hypothetical protein